jgi:hypothetical protein
MPRRIRIAIVSAALLAAMGLPMLPASAIGTTTISGVAFQDDNRNGVQDVGEAPRSGDSLYLFDSAGTCVAVQTTDANGRYAFAGITDGTYRVEYTSSTWWSIRADWVPTTTGGLNPSRTVTTPAPSVDFGWRRVVRSTTASAPISSFTGPEGLRVASYDDVVPARDLYDALLRGTVGREASSVTVLFDLGSNSTTTASVGATNGRYDSYSASSYVAYDTWLDGGDNTLSHEYGHAWTLYYAYLAQQDPTFAGYLSARHLTGDARLGTSYAWSPREMIAEDYRQLLGSPTAAAATQMNQDIPRATDVPGLRDYLLTTFTTAATAPAPTPTPSPTASPSPSASPAPSLSSSPTPTASATASPTPLPSLSASPTASPTPTNSPTPTASPTATTSPTPTSSPTPTRTKGGGCHKPC